MATLDQIHVLRNEMHQELTYSILPYWMNRVADHDRGGYHGRIDGSNEIDLNGSRSAILNTRILWTFSSSYRILQKPDFFPHIQRAMDYLENHFLDQKNGGIYWSLDADGNPLDSRKHTYAQSFAIYAYAETYRATGSLKARDRALELFDLLEKHAFLADQGAYYEAFDAAWNKLPDVRLSEQDLDAHRSTNTHLHLMEAFTTLYKASPNDLIRRRLIGLVELFMGPIFNMDTNHFYAFFDSQWNPATDVYSFGHDIETVWLMMDAIHAIGDAGLSDKVKKQLITVADLTLSEGIDSEFGGLFNTGLNGKILDDDKHWWPQAEAIIGFYYAYEISDDERYLDSAVSLWKFIQNKIIDHEHGEWYFRVDRAGNPYHEDKVGFWKCPYHSARACLEIYELTKDLVATE